MGYLVKPNIITRFLQEACRGIRVTERRCPERSRRQMAMHHGVNIQRMRAASRSTEMQEMDPPWELPEGTSHQHS